MPGLEEQRVILLVEDTETDEVLALRALRQAGVHNPVVVVRDGQEAVDWLFREGQHAGRDALLTPQIILLDLKLPRLGGLDVLGRIRTDARTATLPVVILTTSSEETDLVRGYELHCNSYVVKPVDFTQFAQAVRELGLYWLVLNEPPPVRR